MGRMPSCFPSKNTPLRRSPLTPKSPCRSPSSRVYSPSRCTIKIRWLRNNTNYSYTYPLSQRTSIPVYCFSPMGHHYDRLHLPSTNRPKIHDCLLIRKPHGPSSWRNSYPNPLRIYRSNYFNNCPRPCLISAFLPGKHQL